MRVFPFYFAKKRYLGTPVPFLLLVGKHFVLAAVADSPGSSLAEGHLGPCSAPDCTDPALAALTGFVGLLPCSVPDRTVPALVALADPVTLGPCLVLDHIIPDRSALAGLGDFAPENKTNTQVTVGMAACQDHSWSQSVL